MCRSRQQGYPRSINNHVKDEKCMRNDAQEEDIAEMIKYAIDSATAVITRR